ncbi:MFS transporter [Streptomyces lasalocidi]
MLGGGLVELGGWRLVFLVNPPLALAALLLARRLPAPPVGAARALDRTGLLLSTAGLGLLTFGLVEAGIEGWGAPRALLPLAAALVCFGAVVVVERRAAVPVLPPALLALARVRAAMVAAAVSCFAYFGGMYLLAVWLQHTYDLTPLRAGLAALPMAFPVCVMPFFTGRLVARYGPRPVLLTGMSATVAAGALLACAAGHHPPLALIVAAELALAAAGDAVHPGCRRRGGRRGAAGVRGDEPGRAERDPAGRIRPGRRGAGHTGRAHRGRVPADGGRGARGAAAGQDR